MGSKNVRVFFCVAHRTICVLDCVDHKDKRQLPSKKYRDLCKKCRAHERREFSCCGNS